MADEEMEYQITDRIRSRSFWGLSRTPRFLILGQSFFSETLELGGIHDFPFFQFNKHLEK